MLSLPSPASARLASEDDQEVHMEADEPGWGSEADKGNAHFDGK